MTVEVFRHVCAVLPDPVLLLGADGVLLGVSVATAELLHCSPSDLPGKNIRDLAAEPGENLERLIRMWARSRELLPGSLPLKGDGGRTVECRAQGRLVIPRTAAAEAVILVRLYEKETATTAFRTLTDRVERLNAEILTRQRAQAILHSHREWLRATLASMDEGLIATDRDGHIRFMNRVAEILTGWTAREATGLPVENVLSMVDQTTRLPVQNPALATPSAAHRTVLVARDGTERPVENGGAPIVDEQGVVSGAVFTFRDVTPQRRANDAIARTEERLRVALKNAPVFLYTTDADLRYTWMHRPWPGFSAGEFLGKRTAEIFPLAEVQELVDLETRVRERGTGERREIVLRTGENAGVYDVTAEPLVNDGVVAGLTVAMLDVSERARAQQASRDSERQFRQLADSMPQMVWTARPDGSLDYRNERWYEFTGVARGQSGDGYWAPALHPDDVQRCHETWSAAILSGEAYEIETRFWDRGSDRYRWFLSRALPVRNESGELIRWFGTSTDIDSQKRLLENLRQVNEDLSQFAYSASHDLKEPLRMIAVYSQLLGRKLRQNADPEIAEYVGHTIRGAQRMEALVRDLLAYTEAGNPELFGVEEVDCGRALAEAMENLKFSIGESGAEIVSGELPVLPARAIHMVQLFQNLLGNAMKYRGEQPPRISVTVRRRPAEWEFAVADNGIGIPSLYHSHIFGVFKRLHTREHSQGTGIGLAICKRIVEHYSGRIWVESEPGKGSTFRFTLSSVAGRIIDDPR